jgi:Tol biopolymer transport system component
MNNVLRASICIALFCGISFCTISCHGPRGGTFAEVPIGGKWVSLSWSPKGDELLLTSIGLREITEISRYDLQAQTLRQIVEFSPSFTQSVGGAAWSPSGKYIAYVETSSVAGVDVGVRVMTSDGKLLDPRYPGVFMAWSPDGERLAVTNSAPAMTRDRKATICIFKVEQRDCQLIWDRSMEEIGYFSGISWMPDGNSVTFSLAEKKAQADLYTLDIASGHTTRLTSTVEASETGPAWSPDGRWLAYIRHDLASSNDSIVVVSSDLRRKVVVVESEHPRSPAWSPDGNRLAFIEDGDVYLADVEATLQQLEK